jgi:hypothetical protein
MNEFMQKCFARISFIAHWMGGKILVYAFVNLGIIAGLLLDISLGLYNLQHFSQAAYFIR